MHIGEPKFHLNLTYMLSQAHIALIWKIFFPEWLYSVFLTLYNAL